VNAAQDVKKSFFDFFFQDSGWWCALHEMPKNLAIPVLLITFLMWINLDESKETSLKAVSNDLARARSRPSRPQTIHGQIPHRGSIPQEFRATVAKKNHGR
jgi:hypothetical protein